VSDARTISARWVFPAAGPPIENGRVTVRGTTIESVGPPESRAADEHLGNVALIPGLVNPHTHLDLSGAQGLIQPENYPHFTDWLKAVIAYRRTRTATETQADIRAGLQECLRFGTTLVGDIAAEGQSWDALSNEPTRAVVFRELIGLSPARTEQVLQEAKDWNHKTPDTDLCRKGFSPHSPFSASAALIAGAGQLCKESNRPLAIHLAESAAETEFVYQRTGPFVQFLKDLNVWTEAGLVADFSDAMVIGEVQQPMLFIHGNRLSPSTNVPNNGTIVYCPRTHAAFGHPPHPFREFLNRGIRVVLGTDSLASNPDLDVLAEARYLRAKFSDLPGDVLLRMVTLSGAEALGWANETGSLEPGKSADLVVIPMPNLATSDPHDLLFASDLRHLPRRTMFRGTWQ